MFVLLANNEFYNFWGNRPGDIFLEATMRALKFDAGKVKLLHFSFLDSRPEFFALEGNALIIKEKIVTQELQPKIQDTDPDIYLEVVSYSNKDRFEGEVYFENGVYVKPC